MTRLRIIPWALFLLSACGPAKTETADAGPDTSCGFDCAAQQTYGLIIGRCFEYSSTMSAQNPASIGAWVKPMETLEGNVSVIPVEYRESGQIKMTDFFRIENRELLLARRSFLPGESVTYKDSEGKISGVTWLWANALSGENQSSTATATLLGIGDGGTEETTFKVVLGTPSASELLTSLARYEAGLQMLLSETPDHGVDTRRIFVAQTGFVQFNTAFSATPGQSALPYRLQNIRDINDGDVECGFGAP